MATRCMPRLGKGTANGLCASSGQGRVQEPADPGLGACWVLREALGQGWEAESSPGLARFT